jgi:hypothetical protein
MATVRGTFALLRIAKRRSLICQARWTFAKQRVSVLLLYADASTCVGLIHFLVCWSFPVPLTEHYAMIAYWETGGMVPRILDLGTRWRWVVSFTPLPLYPQGKSPWYPLDRRLGLRVAYRFLRWNWITLRIWVGLSAAETRAGRFLRYEFRQRCWSASLCSRNRLESNSEHWNALLLSLRELIEWVIRKDTELTGLGPIGGDVACLQKQQVSVCLTQFAFLFYVD